MAKFNLYITLTVTGCVIIYVIFTTRNRLGVLEGDSRNLQHNSNSSKQVFMKKHRPNNSKERFEDFLITPTDQGDFEFIQFVSSRIVPPSEQPYNLVKTEALKDYSQFQTQPLIDRLFVKQRDGKFFEAGALDGEYLSSTLHLEMNYGWTGILVEPNSDSFRKLLLKNRKSFCLNACLSPVPHPQKLFIEEKKRAAYNKVLNKQSSKAEAVECFPLFSILSAVNMTSIDLVISDIEGFEVKVLESFPFNLVNVKVLIIEWNHVNKSELNKLMAKNGFRRVLLDEGKSTHWLNGLYIRNDYAIPVPVSS